MSDFSSKTSANLPSALIDFINTINCCKECVIEMAFASPGSSKFNSALYFEKIDESTLISLSQLKMNVAFAAGYDKKSMDNLILGTKTARIGRDGNIKFKNILGFDLDFKFNVTNYCEKQRSQLTDKFSQHLKDVFDKHNIPIWMMVFSGNGIHVYFKLETPYTLTSTQRYKQIYEAIKCYLECVSEVKFDQACSNPSRLLRLPFSTNWKDRNSPVQCEVLYHNPYANFSLIFEGFASITQFKPQEEGNSVYEKQAIAGKIDLQKILDHFEYDKRESIKEKSNKIICSSPFNPDRTPSFYYDKQSKLFYDFSSGFGGDLFDLIGKLAHLDRKKEFPNILALAGKISGVAKNEIKESCFELNEGGLWYRQSPQADPLWLSSPIFVEALTRDSANRSWGRLLTFKDQDGINKSWSMPMELLACEGSEIRRNLLCLGAELAVGKRERLLFLSYLQGSQPTRRVRCVNRIGWHQNQFVLPDKIYSPSEQETGIILQELKSTAAFGVSGDIKGWQNNVGRFCVGNSRLVLAVSAALASVLLKSMGEECGGFNIVGPSSIGKSITLKVAASVWGNPGLNGFIKRWRSTINGLELLAASRCDSLLILDELGEIQPKDAGNVSYMLCGGISKSRATKETTLSNSLEWRLLFLSSGELTLAAHMAQSGAAVNVGQEIRMLDIPAETSGSQGIFQNIHGFESAGIFASLLSQNTENYFGSAIHDFLGKIIKNPGLFEKLTDKRREFVDLVNNKSQHGQVHRAIKRFSLLAAAGELGIELKTLPWSSGEALSAAHQCFMDWYQSWAFTGSREKQQLIEQIKHLLQEFGPSRFPLIQSFKENSSNHQHQLWGFRREMENDNYEWLILSEIFKNVFCKGHDYRRALRDLKEENYLIASPGKSSMPIRVPHLGVTRVARISSAILA